MSLDEFLKEKQALEEAKEASKKKDFHDKCIQILGKIKEKSEEKYHELSHLFHGRLSSPNIQRKVIMGVYAQLVAEMKALDPTPILTQAATHIKKEVKASLATTKQKAHAIGQKVEQVKKLVKKETKTVKKAAPPAKSVKKATPKKVAAKKASPVAKKKVAAGTAKKKTVSKKK